MRIKTFIAYDLTQLQREVNGWVQEYEHKFYIVSIQFAVVAVSGGSQMVAQYSACATFCSRLEGEAC